MSANRDQPLASGSHPVLALSKMKSLRDKSALCDVTLEVGPAKIPAHKVVLAASSPYFEFMFTSRDVKESIEENIEIKGFCPTAFLAVIDFMYSGYLLVNEETITDILKVADFLKIATAKKQCLNYMQKHINISNCIVFRNIARKHFYTELEETVNNFISCNFVNVIKSAGFFELTLNELKDFITEDSLTCDYSLCENAISSWIDHDNSTREDYRETIFRIAKVYIESIKERDSTIYNTSCHRRIFCYYKENDFSYAFDLNNSTWYCVRPGPSFEHYLPVFHNNSICLISLNRNECGIYNLQEEKWTTNIMPFKNLYSGACSDHNRIYLTTSEDSKDTFSYDVERNVLYPEPPLIRKRTSPGVTFNENCIYVCGGARDTAEFRDIRTKGWRSINCLPVREGNTCATSLHNKVYCSSCFGEFLQYDNSKAVWVNKASIPGCTNGCLIGSTDEAVYAHNGTELYKYDVKDDRWIHLQSVMSMYNFVCVYPR